MITETKQILIVTHASEGSTKGNRITAERWAELLQFSGHIVHVANDFDGQDPAAAKCDVLIALHANHSAGAIAAFRQMHSSRRIILCLTGTDLHLGLQGHRGADVRKQTSDSIRIADKLILLEPEGVKQLPNEARIKTTVVHQSAVAVPSIQRAKKKEDVFEICVIGHLRDEKDPFLAAHASRHLPTSSKIKILHFGAALDQKMQRQAEREMELSSRYLWLGALPYIETQRRLASCRAMVLSSKIEGAPSVISEAVVNGVPILATRIDATIGLLGNNYPGLFSVGDELELKNLMGRLETDADFVATLQQAIAELRSKFAPEIERAKLNDLIVQL